MAEKSGKCTNLGSCTEANTGRIISLPMAQDFKCPECGSTLVEIKIDKGKKSSIAKIVAAAIVVIALLVVASIFYFNKKEPETAKKSPLTATTKPSVAVSGDARKRQAPPEGKVNVPDVVRDDQGDKDKSPSKGY